MTDLIGIEPNGAAHKIGDPVRLEVVRNAFVAAADEMALALQRTAYSTNIKTRLDFSCAIFDGDLRMVAQSFGQPNHLGSLTHFVPAIVNAYGSDNLAEGDALLANGGRHGGVHLNDVCLVAPVFYEGERLGFVADLAHHVDVGGGQPGSISGLSREVYQEGISIPPVKLLRAGKIDSDIFALVMDNIRSPRETGGDLRAQVAAVNVGTRRVQELACRYGRRGLDEVIDELLDYTERRAREEISRIPTGSFQATGYMDDDGVSDDPVKITVSLRVDTDGVEFDLTGSDEQRPCAINATYAMTLSSCAYILRALMADDIPVNEGFYRIMRLVAPERSIVNSRPPVAIGGGWETAFRIVEVGFQALAEAIPERLAAGSKGCLCNVAFGGAGREGGDEYYVFYEAVGGGYGARSSKDGIDAVQPHVQNTENAPIEETEASYPVRIERYELIPDSEGPGKWRGGLGLRRDYYFETPVVFSVLADKAKFAPYGLAGGQPGRPARYLHKVAGGGQQVHRSKTTLALAAGDVFSVEMAGGGGYGDPRERDEQSVIKDVVSGKISPRRAKEVYGVVVEADPLQAGFGEGVSSDHQREPAREERSSE